MSDNRPEGRSNIPESPNRESPQPESPKPDFKLGPAVFVGILCGALISAVLSYLICFLPPLWHVGLETSQQDGIARTRAYLMLLENLHRGLAET